MEKIKEEKEGKKTWPVLPLPVYECMKEKHK